LGTSLRDKREKQHAVGLNDEQHDLSGRVGSHPRNATSEQDTHEDGQVEADDVLNQSTQRNVAISTAARFRPERCRQIASALKRPLIVSARALSYEFPTLPTEGTSFASAERWV
jgi:hypothetical protein